MKPRHPFLVAQAIITAWSFAVTCVVLVSATALPLPLSAALALLIAGSQTVLWQFLPKHPASVDTLAEGQTPASAEHRRIREALDALATPVRIADENGSIVYLNIALQSVLSRYEAAFESELADFDALKAPGGPAGTFHVKLEEAQAQLNVECSTSSLLRLGDRSFEVTTTQIRGPNRELIGSVDLWLDRTDQLASESEVAALLEAATAGDFSQRIGLDGKEGFFKQLGEAMNRLMMVSQTGLDEVHRKLGALAEGDPTESGSSEYRGTVGPMKMDSNNTVRQLVRIVSSIKLATEAINIAASKITCGEKGPVIPH